MKIKFTSFKFKPFSNKQLKVLTWWMPESPVYDKDAIIADGAVRSGKTLPMSLSYVIWAMTTFNNQLFGMAGKTIGSFRRNVLFLLKIMLRSRGYKIQDKRADNLLIVKKGGIVNYFYIFGGKDERSQDLIQGITLAGMLFDEVTLMPESFVNQAVARCSVEGARLWFNCNPEGPHYWFKVEWIDKLDEKNAIHLHFTMDDNLSLSEKVKERYRRMFSGMFFKRYILGLWVMAEGVIYDMFEDAVHVINKLPEKLGRDGKRIDDVKQLFEKLYLGIDYATGNPTAFIMAGVIGQNVYVVDEYYWDSKKEGRQKTDSEYSEDLRKFIKGREPNAIVIDPSAASFILQLKRDGVQNIRNAENEVLDGIRNVSALLQNKRLFIYKPKCPNILKEFSSYIWDAKAQERGVDEPVKQNDHALDALRYITRTLLKYLVPGPLPQYKVVERKVNHRTGY